MTVRGILVLIPLYWFCLFPICFSVAQHNLRFGKNGEFKILQVADMHFANGKTTHCLDVLPSQYASCSDLNTTLFIQRMIHAENPDLIVFTGIYILFLFPLFISFCLTAQRCLFLKHYLAFTLLIRDTPFWCDRG